MEAIAAGGMSAVHSVTGSTGVIGKRRIEERSTFDKRLRVSVRQTESAYRYRDIVVKKQDGFTYILLSTKSSENNALNPEVRTSPNSSSHQQGALLIHCYLTGYEGDPERHGDRSV